MCLDYKKCDNFGSGLIAQHTYVCMLHTQTNLQKLLSLSQQSTLLYSCPDPIVIMYLLFIVKFCIFFSSPASWLQQYLYNNKYLRKSDVFSKRSVSVYLPLNTQFHKFGQTERTECIDFSILCVHTMHIQNKIVDNQKTSWKHSILSISIFLRHDIQTYCAKFLINDNTG